MADHQKDPNPWPVEHGRPISAVIVWHLMLKEMRIKIRTSGQVAGSITDVAWVLREREMDRVQKVRDAYVEHYRPIQTLDGLDPSRPRVEMRRVIKALEAFTIVMRTGI